VLAARPNRARDRPTTGTGRSDRGESERLGFRVRETPKGLRREARPDTKAGPGRDEPDLIPEHRLHRNRVRSGSPSKPVRLTRAESGGLAPAERRGDVSEDVLDDVSVVFDAELVGHGKQQRVCRLDRLVVAELLNEHVGLGGV
jgi:hypothetical protein